MPGMPPESAFLAAYCTISPGDCFFFSDLVPVESAGGLLETTVAAARLSEAKGSALRCDAARAWWEAREREATRLPRVVKVICPASASGAPAPRSCALPAFHCPPAASGLVPLSRMRLGGCWRLALPSSWPEEPACCARSSRGAPPPLPVANAKHACCASILAVLSARLRATEGDSRGGQGPCDLDHITAPHLEAKGHRGEREWRSIRCITICHPAGGGAGRQRRGGSGLGSPAWRRCGAHRTSPCRLCRPARNGRAPTAIHRGSG